ncbi:indoleamine 2,3-dioxygenase 2 [Microcaecilia unicolor]|uniref:Indoleamine 2,3-dioxygenase 2-like n=1 Tax=Microcaecilia unicolor TaxID=1415580 RepID=A0A6P7XYL5_9AMPH|nr:indoleamine 2,3-dioxygenase 2-like [Microcaecilia unicolor]
MDINSAHQKTSKPFSLEKFYISEEYGFILPNPLTELPEYYGPWMKIAKNLPHLIEKRQLRSEVHMMPELNIQYLNGHRELRLAHLALSFITMGYVWQEGEQSTVKVLPRNLAVPYYEISQTLGLPPILVHADLVLANWKKRNPNGPLKIENLDPIVSLPGGESLRGFILVTFLVELAAVPGLKAIVQTVDALLQRNAKLLHHALHDLAKSIEKMTEALKQMHDYVDSEIFYTVIRIFLSGWKDNAAMPEGLVYEGVAEDPKAYSGGSAAQSTILHAFDELLGISHSQESAAFLHRMRDYMPPHHKAFIEEINASPSLQQHILTTKNQQLFHAYNECVATLVKLRTYHIAIVSKYVSLAGVNAKAKGGKIGSLYVPSSALEERGTGGSPIMSFLKNVRDATKDVMIS